MGAKSTWRAIVLLTVVGVLVSGCGAAAPRETVLPTAPSVAASPTASASSTPSVTAPTASASAVPAPDDGSVDCAGAPVALSGAEQSFVLTGECPTVTVGGTGITVEATNARIGSVQMSGDRNRLATGAVDALVIGGQNNVGQVGETGAVTLNGDRNAIEAAGGIGQVTVSGNDNTVFADSLGTVSDQGQRNTVAAR